MKKAKLAQLLSLQKTQYTCSAVALSGLEQKQNRLRNRMAEIANERTNATKSLGEVQSGAMPNEIRWLAWLDQQERETNIALAALTAEIEIQKAKIKPLYGKQLVLEALITDAKNPGAQDP